MTTARRIMDRRDVARRRVRELRAELQRLEREISALDRRIDNALAGRGSGPRAYPRGPRGLRPDSLASAILTVIARSKGGRARVSDIARALKGWRGKQDPGVLLRHVSATISNHPAYFRRVKRGLYAASRAG